MKILLKAQACLPLPLGFVLHLLLLTSTLPLCPHFKGTRDGRSRPCLSRAGSGRRQGAGGSKSWPWWPGGPVALQPPSAGGTHPACPVQAGEEGRVSTAHSRWPLCQPSSFPGWALPLLATPGYVDSYKPVTGIHPASHWPGPSATWHQKVGVGQGALCLSGISPSLPSLPGRARLPCCLYHWVSGSDVTSSEVATVAPPLSAVSLYHPPRFVSSLFPCWGWTPL